MFWLWGLIFGTFRPFFVSLAALVLDPHFDPFGQGLARTPHFACPFSLTALQFPNEAADSLHQDNGPPCRLVRRFVFHRCKLKRPAQRPRGFLKMILPVNQQNNQGNFTGKTSIANPQGLFPTSCQH